MNKNQRSIREQRRKAGRRRKIRKICCGIVYAFVLIFCLTAVFKTLNIRRIRDNAGVKAAVIDVNLEDIPDSLIELKEKNPETEEFVNDYLKDKDLYTEIDISGEVRKGKIPLFIQWDKRWGYKEYGGDFFAVTGCGPTCLSMVYSGITGKSDLNPYEIGKMAEEQGYYVDGVGTSWDMMTGMASEIGLSGREVIFDEEHIISALENGKPIICIMGPGDFTTTGHFIVLVGVDSNGKIIVNDPNSKERSKKTWSIDTIMSQVKNLWCFE